MLKDFGKKTSAALRNCLVTMKCVENSCKLPAFYNHLPVNRVLPAYTRTCSDEVFKMALVLITLDMWGKGVRKQPLLNRTLEPPACTTHLPKSHQH